MFTTKTSLGDSMISFRCHPLLYLIITSRYLLQHVHSYVNVSDWCKKLRNDTDCLACDNQSECYIFSHIRQAGIILISRKLRCSRFYDILSLWGALDPIVWDITDSLKLHEESQKALIGCCLLSCVDLQFVKFSGDLTFYITPYPWILMKACKCWHILSIFLSRHVWPSQCQCIVSWWHHINSSVCEGGELVGWYLVVMSLLFNITKLVSPLIRSGGCGWL